jgi:hypothetical protein
MEYSEDDTWCAEAANVCYSSALKNMTRKEVQFVKLQDIVIRQLRYRMSQHC